MGNYHIFLLISFFGILILIPNTLAYHVGSGSEVHQHLTKEAVEVWPLIPVEIKEHSGKPISTNIMDSSAFDSLSYDAGDDIIDGSGEEDVPVTNVVLHFWQPDNPSKGNYTQGLAGFFSSYSRARVLFITKVVPLYLKGEINESYYWLGHIVHLLEDATVPAHVHLDCHLPPLAFNFPCGDDDALEEFTANTFQSFDGSSYQGQHYYYEKLPNLNGFDWSTVDANTNYKNFIELFRLFWFTAQRTQYYASNDMDGVL